SGSKDLSWWNNASAGGGWADNTGAAKATRTAARARLAMGWRAGLGVMGETPWTLSGGGSEEGAAVHLEHLAGDEGGLVGGEVERRRAHLLGLCHGAGQGPGALQLGDFAGVDGGDCPAEEAGLWVEAAAAAHGLRRLGGGEIGGHG